MIARRRKTHLPLPFSRSVKSFLSCGARPGPFPRLLRLPLFFAPTEYPWVPLVLFCSAISVPAFAKRRVFVRGDAARFSQASARIQVRDP
jgi:hypothetical protein